jgi:hypothetical protein
MLKRSPDERITIEELAQHPWIRDSVRDIYFEKSFQMIGSTNDDDQEIGQKISKWGLDSSKM